MVLISIIGPDCFGFVYLICLLLEKMQGEVHYDGGTFFYFFFASRKNEMHWGPSFCCGMLLIVVLALETYRGIERGWGGRDRLVQISISETRKKIIGLSNFMMFTDRLIKI
jgi:hypothetical protein